MVSNVEPLNFAEDKNNFNYSQEAKRLYQPGAGIQLNYFNAIQPNQINNYNIMPNQLNHYGHFPQMNSNSSLQPNMQITPLNNANMNGVNNMNMGHFDSNLLAIKNDTDLCEEQHICDANTNQTTEGNKNTLIQIDTKKMSVTKRKKGKSKLNKREQKEAQKLEKTDKLNVKDMNDKNNNGKNSLPNININFGIGAIGNINAIAPFPSINQSYSNINPMPMRNMPHHISHINQINNIPQLNMNPPISQIPYNPMNELPSSISPLSIPQITPSNTPYQFPQRFDQIENVELNKFLHINNPQSGPHLHPQSFPTNLSQNYGFIGETTPQNISNLPPNQNQNQTGGFNQNHEIFKIPSLPEINSIYNQENQAKLQFFNQPDFEEDLQRNNSRKKAQPYQSKSKDKNEMMWNPLNIVDPKLSKGNRNKEIKALQAKRNESQNFTGISGDVLKEMPSLKELNEIDDADIIDQQFSPVHFKEMKIVNLQSESPTPNLKSLNNDSKETNKNYNPLLSIPIQESQTRPPAALSSNQANQNPLGLSVFPLYEQQAPLDIVGGGLGGECPTQNDLALMGGYYHPHSLPSHEHPNKQNMFYYIPPDGSHSNLYPGYPNPEYNINRNNAAHPHSNMGLFHSAPTFMHQMPSDYSHINNTNNFPTQIPSFSHPTHPTHNTLTAHASNTSNNKNNALGMGMGMGKTQRQMVSTKKCSGSQNNTPASQCTPSDPETILILSLMKGLSNKCKKSNASAPNPSSQVFSLLINRK